MIEVHALKFQRDPLRREPQNVGVFTLDPEGTAAARHVAYRLLTQGQDGQVSPRAISGVPREMFLLWVDYFHEKLANGRGSDLRRLANSRPTSFYLDHVMTLMDEIDPESALEKVYGDLVTEKKPPERERLDDKVEQALKQAQIHPVRDYPFDGLLDGDVLPAEFGYGFQNGRLHLMDRVSTPATAPSMIRRNANDFAWRADLARTAKVSDSFVSFVDLEGVSEDIIDDGLRVLYKVSNVANVADWDATIDLLTSLRSDS